MIIFHKPEGTDEKAIALDRSYRGPRADQILLGHVAQRVLTGRKICMTCGVDYGPAGTESDSHGLCPVCGCKAREEFLAKPKCGVNGCTLFPTHVGDHKVIDWSKE